MSARGIFLAALALALAVLAACSGESGKSGLGEPLLVRNATFKEGPLPGAPATDGGDSDGVTITAIETSSTVLRPGQGEKTLTGRASVGAVAVALALGDLGHGYWLLPVDGPDPLNNGELGWQVLLEIARSVPPGKRDLRIVAVDAAGRAGTQRSLSVCVPGLVPDNLNACDPKIAPPAAVVSLTWDTPVDLDLVAVGPNGNVIDPKHSRGSVVVDAGASVPPTLDRDSNAACSLDLVQTENLVFTEIPPPGSYLVFVNLFDACGHAPVHFKVSVYSRQAKADGTFELALAETKSGTLTDVAANGGSEIGTYVTEVAF